MTHEPRRVRAFPQEATAAPSLGKLAGKLTLDGRRQPRHLVRLDDARLLAGTAVRVVRGLLPSLLLLVTLHLAATGQLFARRELGKLP